MSDTLELSDLIQKAQAIASTNDIDDAVGRCDANITPLYPVRYAYANFFTEALSEPTEPPPLPGLLGINDLQATQGYVIRLLREGWVYIREEDDPQNGYWYIFKYSRRQTEPGQPVTEHFEKYIFANGVNAQRSLIRDTSAGRSSYPFAFVRKGQANISIAYSEHEWSANVIGRLHGDATLRAKSMQRVNLETGNTEHSVAASAENFNDLIEDYRTRQSRMLALQEADSDPELEDLSLDILTSEASYQMDAANIANELQSKLCYGETARIVALHDPLGRQKEIAAAHGKLAIWQQDYNALNLYPLTIGGFVAQLLNSTNADIKEAAQDNINIAEHAQYWGEMEANAQEFENRQKAFSSLYQGFMCEGGQVGTLDSYFKYFFDHAPSDDATTDAELQKLLEHTAPVFAGVLASVPGKQALDQIVNAAAQYADEDIENNPNAYGVFSKIMVALVTQPQAEFQWSGATTRAMDQLLNGIGAYWGELIAWAEYSGGLAQRGANQLTATALQHVVDGIIPQALKVYGLQVTGNKVRLSREQLGKTLAQAIGARSEQAALSILQNAERQMQRGQRLFDWGNRQQGRLGRIWLLAEIEVTRATGSAYAFQSPQGVTQKIGLLFDGGFSGLSAFFNVMTITSLSNQSRFAQANPLGKGGLTYDVLNFSAAISALTADIINIGAASYQLASSSRLLSATVASRLIPSLGGQARDLGRFLTGTLAPRLIMAANFAGAVVSTWNSVNAFNDKNYGEFAGHAMLALGSAMLFAGAAGTVISVGAGTASTGFGLPLGLVIMAFGLILGGIALVYLFQRTPFENMLRNCFWGNGPRYGFWSSSEDRSPFKQRLITAQQIQEESIAILYRIELQEFMNYLCMPQLKLNRYSHWFYRWFGYWGRERTYDLEFKLPGFQPGVSELIGAFYTLSHIDEDGILIITPDENVTQALKDAIENAANQGGLILGEGVATLKTKVTLQQRANLFWYYQPNPDTVVPLRLLGNDGDLRAPQQIIGGMRNEQPM